MSTPCTIRMIDDYMPYWLPIPKAINVQHDGHPSRIMPILRNWYNTSESIEPLLELGDLHSIDCYLSKCVAYHRDRGEELAFSGYAEHTFDKLDSSGHPSLYVYQFNKSRAGKGWHAFKATREGVL